jgi:hypothetical protein
MKVIYCFWIFLFTIFLSCPYYTATSQGTEINSSGISINREHPYYWEYKGQPILLLGGSVEDNLFQIDSLGDHLDLLQSVGGNYVRNTMSSRDSANVWPFALSENGLYDLGIWNEEYWTRFEHFLQETSRRDIVVQIELWATFDFYREFWEINPFNPKNNLNYDSRRSKLSESVDSHPTYTENNFFRSVPSQMALAQVLWFQQQFVDKMLSYSLPYDHIIYCMDNETSVSSEWGKYWARYIQKEAKLAGKEVYTTEMWDPHDLSHPFHSETFDNPDIFQFVDISQNNHQSADAHWYNGLQQIKRLEDIGAVRPLNNVKVYGNDGGAHKTTRDGIENFIQNVLMGCASSRFHRPSSGQGLNEIAQGVIKSMRELTEKMEFFGGMAQNELLESRDPGEAYCRASIGREYAIYFPDGGEVEIDLSDLNGEPTLVWLDVLKAEWSAEETIAKGTVQIIAPSKGHWIALIR